MERLLRVRYILLYQSCGRIHHDVRAPRSIMDIHACHKFSQPASLPLLFLNGAPLLYKHTFSLEPLKLSCFVFEGPDTWMRAGGDIKTAMVSIR